MTTPRRQAVVVMKAVGDHSRDQADDDTGQHADDRLAGEDLA